MKSKTDLPPHSIADADTLARYSQDMVYAGHPDFVHIMRDLKDTQEVLSYCHANAIPVTFCGSQTSMTGASVADSGLTLALQNQNRILDIGTDPHTGEPFVVTEPGVILGDLKDAVLREGLFYPPDPTSYREAQVGATIATNATGEETFAFGPTRWHVQELEVLTADGTIKTLKRTRPPSKTIVKNSAGYFLDSEEIDEVIGSEGTLSLITKARLQLLKNTSPGRFLLILPFADFKNALEGAVKIINGPHRPRALELIGPGAGRYFSECLNCPTELKDSKIFLYIRDDFASETEKDTKLSNWFDFFKKLYASCGETKNTDKIFVAASPRELEDIRLCRHHIPLKVNETSFAHTRQGGGKIGTDWWVPTQHIPQMMLDTFKQATELGLPYLVFGHIGNGHPHWNFLTRTAEERQKAFDLAKTLCAQAVRFGGGVAGEHGLGKIKRELLAIQHNPGTIKKMLAIKHRWDPKNILGRGNIF